MRRIVIVIINSSRCLHLRCRLIASGEELISSIIPNSTIVFRFDEAYGLNSTMVP